MDNFETFAYKKNTYLFKDILSITSKGISYMGKDEIEKHIDFERCRLNWVNHINTTERYVSLKSGEIICNVSTEETNCVGQRNWYTDKPYIEFFSNPFIRFEIIPKKKFYDFFNKNWRMRYYKDFSTIQNQIDAAGWSTFDMG